MIHHKSHAQEVLTSEMNEENTKENIRKLALDIERLRHLYGEDIIKADKLEDRLKEAEDKLFWMRVYYYAFIICLLAAIIIKLFTKHLS